MTPLEPVSGTGASVTAQDIYTVPAGKALVGWIHLLSQNPSNAYRGSVGIKPNGASFNNDHWVMPRSVNYGDTNFNVGYGSIPIFAIEGEVIRVTMLDTYVYHLWGWLEDISETSVRRLASRQGTTTEFQFYECPANKEMYGNLSVWMVTPTNTQVANVYITDSESNGANVNLLTSFRQINSKLLSLAEYKYPVTLQAGQKIRFKGSNSEGSSYTQVVLYGVERSV